LKRFLGISAFLLIPIFFAGCNSFDSIDTSLAERSQRESIQEGNIALRGGDFPLAWEIFQKLYYEKGNRSPETVRGLGEARAGLAGFDLTRVLDALQNGVGGFEHASVIFRAANTFSDRKGLESAVSILMENPDPNRSDHLARGLMSLCAAARVLLDKYDTNRNGKLDSIDDIDFETNDKTTPSWPEIYQRLIAGNASSAGSLEQAFTDLVLGFNGRGESWTFFTPIESKQMAGNFTSANKATITAAAELAERVKAANPFFNVHLASFSAAIREIDGAE